MGKSQLIDRSASTLNIVRLKRPLRLQERCLRCCSCVLCKLLALCAKGQPARILAHLRSMALLPSAVSHESKLSGWLTLSCCVWLLVLSRTPCRAADALLACLSPPRHCQIAVMTAVALAWDKQALVVAVRTAFWLAVVGPLRQQCVTTRCIINSRGWWSVRRSTRPCRRAPDCQRLSVTSRATMLLLRQDIGRYHGRPCNVPPAVLASCFQLFTAKFSKLVRL